LRILKKDTNHQGITIDTLSEAQVDSEIRVNLENADSYEEKDRQSIANGCQERETASIMHVPESEKSRNVVLLNKL